MSNPLSPDLMTPAERLDEIAELLAVGILRLQPQSLRVMPGWAVVFAASTP